MLWAERFEDCKPIGTITWDRSSKGSGKRHNCWRAELRRGKVRYRKRSKSYSECEDFLLDYVNLHEDELPQRAIQSLRNSFYEQDL
ncbi:MAG TPA: hypothetical protein IAC45_02025 [Candidatus Aphodousia faecavium]|nr:hypothetical protein [Candidatus Aphodousia faecavium]